MLRRLEAGHHVVLEPAPGPPDARQLGLFSPPAAAAHPLLAELGELDVDALSPLEALNQLAAWKQRLGTGEGS